MGRSAPNFKGQTFNKKFGGGYARCHKIFWTLGDGFGVTTMCGLSGSCLMNPVAYSTSDPWAKTEKKRKGIKFWAINKDEPSPTGLKIDCQRCLAREVKRVYIDCRNCDSSRSPERGKMHEEHDKSKPLITCPICKGKKKHWKRVSVLKTPGVQYVKYQPPRGRKPNVRSASKSRSTATNRRGKLPQTI